MKNQKESLKKSGRYKYIMRCPYCPQDFKSNNLTEVEKTSYLHMIGCKEGPSKL